MKVVPISQKSAVDDSEEYEPYNPLCPECSSYLIPSLVDPKAIEMDDPELHAIVLGLECVMCGYCDFELGGVITCEDDEE